MASGTGKVDDGVRENQSQVHFCFCFSSSHNGCKTSKPSQNLDEWRMVEKCAIIGRPRSNLRKSSSLKLTYKIKLSS